MATGKLTNPPAEIAFRDNKDLLTEARNRFLWQFKNSENLCKLVMVFIDQCQELYELAIEAQEQRTLALASGAQLDVLGTLVGQERVGITSVLGLFGFADDDTAEAFAEIIDGESVGGGRFLELGESETGARYLEDSEYRRYIIAKIYKNHLRGATSDELTLIATTILESVTKCQVIDGAESGVLHYYFYAPNGLTTDDELLITSETNDSHAEHQRIITSGAGIRIGHYYVGYGDYVFGFADDTDPNTGGFNELGTTTADAGNFAEIITV